VHWHETCLWLLVFMSMFEVALASGPLIGKQLRRISHILSHGSQVKVQTAETDARCSALFSPFCVCAAAGAPQFLVPTEEMVQRFWETQAGQDMKVCLVVGGGGGGGGVVVLHFARQGGSLYHRLVQRVVASNIKTAYGLAHMVKHSVHMITSGPSRDSVT
jgi:hypothetical protein